MLPLVFCLYFLACVQHTETFKKELVMTSDQALMKNQRLPKGYIYVPMDSLSNGKQLTRDSVERKEQDG